MAAQIPLAKPAMAADSVDFATYAYPAGSIYEEVTGRDADGTLRKYHRIAYFGSAAFSSADFNAAPLASTLTDTTAGSVKLYIKTAATTWTVVGAQS